MLKYLLLLLFCSGCAHKAQGPLDKWVCNMCHKEDLICLEKSNDSIIFESDRKVGIGEARRMIVLLNTRRKDYNLDDTATIRILYRNEDKYIIGYICEAAYYNNEIIYGMMGGQLQEVYREPYGSAMDKIIGLKFTTTIY